MNTSNAVIPFSKTSPVHIHFNRHELNAILNIYGQMVAAGFWKDYAFEYGKNQISFAVFKRSADTPAFRIIKQPNLASKQGAYAVQGQGGQIIKRGKSLEATLKHFQKKLMRIVD